MVKFGSVGGLMIILNIILLYFFTVQLHIYYLISAILSYQILLAASFLLNDKWTFNSVNELKITQTPLRYFSYFLVSLTGMALNVFFLYILTDFYSLYFIYSSIIATFLVFFWNYLINDRLTWRERYGS
jgi:dolichol-phosphate mannosyltransferase